VLLVCSFLLTLLVCSFLLIALLCGVASVILLLCGVASVQLSLDIISEHLSPDTATQCALFYFFASVPHSPDIVRGVTGEYFYEL
jgi:hypothetical protein